MCCACAVESAVGLWHNLGCSAQESRVDGHNVDRYVYAKRVVEGCRLRASLMTAFYIVFVPLSKGWLTGWVRFVVWPRDGIWFPVLFPVEGVSLR